MKRKHLSSFPTILGKELRGQLFNEMVLIAIIVTLVCMVLATIRSADAYSYNVQRYIDNTTISDEQNPRANLSVNVSIKPQPISVMARGASDTLCRPVVILRQLEAGFNIKYGVGDERRQEQLIYALSEDIDPLFVLRILLPIIGLLLSYNAICGEREKGTLKLMLTNAVTRRSILAGKITSAAIVLALVVILCAFTVLFTLWSIGLDIPADSVLRYVMIFAAAYVYSLTFMFIGMLISTIVRTSSLSIIGSLAAWCVLVIIFPGISSSMAESISPSPPTYQVFMEKLAVEREIKGGETRDGSAEELKPLNEKVLEQIAAIEGDFLNTVKRQEQVANIIGFLSPAMNFSVIGTSLSGSGIEDEHALLRQLNQYFRTISKFDDVEAVLLSREKVDDLPEFNYSPLRLNESLMNALPQAAALVIALALLLGLAVRRFNRYDVR